MRIPLQVHIISFNNTHNRDRETEDRTDRHVKRQIEVSQISQKSLKLEQQKEVRFKDLGLGLAVRSLDR
jgi:hypothetical protein